MTFNFHMISYIIFIEVQARKVIAGRERKGREGRKEREKRRKKREKKKERKARRAREKDV